MARDVNNGVIQLSVRLDTCPPQHWWTNSMNTSLWKGFLTFKAGGLATVAAEPLPKVVKPRVSETMRLYVEESSHVRYSTPAEQYATSYVL